LPISPELLPLLESDFMDGPFLFPGAPFIPTELSAGVLACLPVFTPGSAFGASAAIAGAAANRAAKAVAAINLFIAFPSLLFSAYICKTLHPGACSA
jgi:hypothetical protein